MSAYRCEDSQVTELSADDLRRVPDPAWPQIEALIAKSRHHVQVLPADPTRRDVALEALQVTSRSYLGALVSECGALLIDNGWLRILGAGTRGLPGVHEANELSGGPPPLLDVAWDVLGGRFAINGGGLDAPPGEVCYWGPDVLEWRPIGGGHTALVAWSLSAAITDFYEDLRWPGWERDVKALSPDLGLSLMPPPFTAEGRDFDRVTRAAVPLIELHAFYNEMASEISDVPDGTTFELRVTD
jgi:hypothetical protein